MSETILLESARLSPKTCENTDSTIETPRAQALLSVSDLDVALGGRPVLYDVGFSVHPGEFVGVIGPNGAGKTTLIRTILSLVRPKRGTIRVNGESIRRGRGQIGYVPQRHEFMWDFPISVDDVVLTGRFALRKGLRRYRREDFQAGAEALMRVGMTDLRKRPVGELSGGQRQRVLVARALALKPALLLLDEPFTGLDMPTQELLTDLFVRLASEGTAIVMTTHDVVAAAHVCSRLILVNRTIIADDAPEFLNDRDMWKETFQVTDSNPLLKALGVSA